MKKLLFAICLIASLPLHAQSIPNGGSPMVPNGGGGGGGGNSAPGPATALNCNGDFILDQIHGYSSSLILTLSTISDCWNLDGPLSNKTTFQVVNRSTLPAGSPYNFAQSFVTASAVTLAATDHSQVKFQLIGREFQILGWGLSGTEEAANPQSGIMEGWIQCNASVPSYPATIPFWVNNNNVRGGSYRTFIHLVSVPTSGVWTQFSFVIPADIADFWASGINPGVSLVGGYTLGAGANFQTSTVDAWVTGNFFGTSTSTNLVSTLGAGCFIAGLHLRVNNGLAYQPLPYQLEYDRIRHHQWTTFVPGNTPAQNAGTGTGEKCVINPVAAGQPSIDFPLATMMGGIAGGTPGVPTVTLYNPSAANASCRDETAAADVACSVVNNTVSGFSVKPTGTIAAQGDLICVHALVDTQQ